MFNIIRALSKMLDENTISSQNKETLDNWYYTNIFEKGYSDYLEDTVWCNDRSIYSLGPFDPNGGSTYTTSFGSPSELIYNSAARLITYTPSLTCSRVVDRFTVDVKNGNGALTYPIGLLTADEIVLAGASTAENSSYYLRSVSSGRVWTGTPVMAGALAFVDDVGKLDYIINGTAPSPCPSISLKTGFTLTGDGDGTVANPYKIG